MPGVMIIALKHVIRGGGVKVPVVASLSTLSLIIVGSGRVWLGTLIPLALLVSISSIFIDRRRHVSTLRALRIVGASPKDVRHYCLCVASLISISYVGPLIVLRWNPSLYLALIAVSILTSYTLLIRFNIT